jgi:NifU-like protein involved in Fe-S cluster formation
MACERVLDVLGGLSEEGEHCALLAANTLKAAINDCLKKTTDLEEKMFNKY